MQSEEETDDACTEEASWKSEVMQEYLHIENKSEFVLWKKQENIKNY